MAKKTLRDVLIEKGMQAWVDAWDYERNGGRGPEDFISYSREPIYLTWKKQDYITGVKVDVCAQKTPAVLVKLKKTSPQEMLTLQDALLQQGKKAYLKCWDYRANDGKSPAQYTISSDETIHMRMDYHDDETGKDHHFEWTTTPRTIYKSSQKDEPCPYLWLHNGLIKTGFNDYASVNPELMDEWDYEANGKNGLDPTRMAAQCNDDCFWKRRVFDILDGKIKDLKWSAAAYKRALGFGGCPELSATGISRSEKAVAYYIQKYFPDTICNDRTVLSGKELDIYIPSKKVAIEYDGRFYHGNAKKDEIKNHLCEDKGIRLYRIREDGAPILKENENVTVYNLKNWKRVEFEAAIKSLLCAIGVPESEIDVNLKRDYDEITMQAAKANYILLPNNELPEPMMLAKKIQEQTKGTSYETSREESLKMAAKACTDFRSKEMARSGHHPSIREGEKVKAWQPSDRTEEMWTPKKKMNHPSRTTRERER